MTSRLLDWFRDLAPMMRLTVVTASVVVLAGVVFLFTGIYGVMLALGIAGLVALALFGFQRFLGYRAGKRKAEFDSGLVDDIKGARAEIGDRFERALEELKANRVDIYGLPWYFYIGEPQSGKTFTIRTSGVDLPLGTQGISGAGGTRDCDFWFTNEAVILDTAGRLTLQDDEIIDREQWTAVLRFLVRCRPNCPINGVIVGIPCTSLLEDDAETIRRKAEAIQRRLKELQTVLKIHFPVFLVVLKTDLVLGFEPFFKRLPVLERKQLFGWANPNRFDQPFNPEAFDRAFGEVLQALQRWRLKFLHDETAPEAMDQFYPFPDEFRALGPPLRQYLDKIFTVGPYGQAGFFRGFFFTSSLQEGRAIPQAIRSILGGIDEDRPAALDLESVQARSTPFFVREFYMKKVFPEKGLLLRSDRSRLVNALIRGAALWGGAAVLVIGIAILILRIPSVGGKLNRPEALVTAIEKHEYDEDRPFEIARELGDKIESWKNRPGSAPAALFEFFFPEPARDDTLIENLQQAYRHRLWQRHLRPFYEKVLHSVQGTPSGASAAGTAIRTWATFRNRVEAFQQLVDAVASVEGEPRALEPAAEAERFQTLIRASGVVDASKPASVKYYEGLGREYERFVRFGGRVGPLLLASGGRDKDAVWTRLERASEPLVRFAEGLVDAGKLTGRYGVEIGDAIGSWRRLLRAAEDFQKKYEELLGIVPREGDGTPVAFTALDRRRYEDLAAAWKERFGRLAAAWRELQSACEAVNTAGRLEENLDRLKADLDGFFDALAKNVLGGRNASGAVRLRTKLETEHAEVAKRYEAFRAAVIARFEGAGHLVRVRPVAPAGGEKPAGAEPETPAGLVGDARAIYERLSRLDAIVNRDPKEITARWASAESRGTEIESFAASIVQKYSDYRAEVAPPVSAGSPRWETAKLRALLDDVAAGALTTLFAAVLDQYVAWAEEPSAPGRLAYFDWFKKRADPEGRPVGLFATALDEAFLENAYLGHDRQLKALVAFVDPGSAPPEKAEKDAEKAPAVDYRRFEAFGFNLKDRLLDLRNRYELAYLESWKARVTASPLWTEGHAWDQAAGEGKRWPEFQRDLAAGLGRSTIEILAEDVRKSAVHTAKHVTVIPVERRRSAPGHAWSVVLDAYRRKEDTGENLAKILIEFQRALVANLDAEDPAKALAEVRRKRTLWLDLKIEDFRRQNRLEGDLFTQKLLDLAESGKRVLAADCLREFRKDWSETAGPWNAKLAGKFPFDGDRRVDASRLAEGKVEQVAPDDLRQVLRPGGKIRAMCDRYLACFPDVNDAYGLEAGRPRIAFLQACQALQRLLFAEGTGDYQEVKFKVILPGDPGSSTRADASSGGRDVYSLNPFCVRFATGAGAKEEARLYVSTRSVEDLAWTPGAGGSERGFTVVEVLDPERTPLRDNGVPLTFKVEGPWSFLLFLRAFGTPIEDGQSPKPHLTPKAADRRSWFVRCPLGKDEPDRGPVIVYFLVELATAMEPLPDWNEANGAR